MDWVSFDWWCLFPFSSLSMKYSSRKWWWKRKERMAKTRGFGLMKDDSSWVATWDEQEEKKKISGDRITKWHKRRRPVSLLDSVEEVKKERKKSRAFNIHVRLSCCCSFLSSITYLVLCLLLSWLLFPPNSFGCLPLVSSSVHCESTLVFLSSSCDLFLVGLTSTSAVVSVSSLMLLLLDSFRLFCLKVLHCLHFLSILSVFLASVYLSIPLTIFVFLVFLVAFTSCSLSLVDKQKGNNKNIKGKYFLLLFSFSRSVSFDARRRKE